MGHCTFCGRSPAPQFAVTALNGDPHTVGSWRRHVLSLCGRYHLALVEAELGGAKLEGTGERWYAGHVVGRFELKSDPWPR